MDITNTNTINHLSLCSGYEGIGKGLRNIFPNLREIAFVEREGFPIANLVAKMEARELDAAPVFTDVKTFPYGKFRGLVDILSGGFPCQPFSSAGKRQATEDPRHLFPYILTGIRECRPTAVFLENVDGIISAKTGDGESVLKYVLRSLEEVGYRATAGVFSASEVGAPHQRKRVFILADGNNKGLAGWNESQKNHKEGWEKPCGYVAKSGANRNIWPSKPGEPQHEWEAPRVMADTKGQQGASGNHGAKQRASGESRQSESGRGCSGSLWESDGQTKSGLGGATNGASSRVDRLRLLGNGVVPATAAKAFITLIQLLV